MTSNTKSHIDLSKAVDPTKAPRVPMANWDLDGTVLKNSENSKSLPSPFEVHGRGGTMVILMVGMFYMGTVMFMVYMAKAALG